MIEISIGEAKRSFSDLNHIEESWITKEINGRIDDDMTLCVKIRIKEGSFDVVLSTIGCYSTGKSRKPKNRRELKLLHLWEKCKLNNEDFNGGNVVSFLKQLRHII